MEGNFVLYPATVDARPEPEMDTTPSKLETKWCPTLVVDLPTLEDVDELPPLEDDKIFSDNKCELGKRRLERERKVVFMGTDSYDGGYFH